MLNITITPLPQPHRLVLVEDDLEKLNKLYEECWLKQKRNIELPGFRKGEVPRSIAEKKLELEKLYKPVLDQLIKEGIQKLEEPFTILDSVAVEWQTEKHPLTLIIKGYYFPKVLECDYTDIVTNYEKLMVTDEEINTVITRAAYSEAVEDDLETVPDDTSNVQVVIDFIMEDVELNKVLANQPDYLINPSKNDYGFEQKLIGQKKDDLLDVKLTLPKDFFSPQLAGREVNYKIKIKRIYTLKLPIINDELAVKIGYKSLDDMRISITRDLEQDKRRTDQILYRDHVMALLVAKTKTTPIPDVVVKDELEKMLKNAVKKASSMQGTNMTVDQFLSASGIDKAKWFNAHWHSAVSKLIGNMALLFIYDKEGMTVTDNDCEKVLDEILPKEMREESRAKVDQEGLKQYVQLKKAQDFLIELIDAKGKNE